MHSLNLRSIDATEFGRLVDGGCTPAQIAQRLRITFQTAHMLMRRHQSGRLPSSVLAIAANDQKPAFVPKYRRAAPKIIELHAAGLWTSEIVRQSGVCYVSVRNILRENGLEPHDGRKRVQEGCEAPNAERNARMVSMYRQGLTLAKVGEAFGVTRERARQIIRKHGTRREDGGQSKLSRVRVDARAVVREAKCLALWGLPLIEVARWRANGVLAAYTMQRSNAARRGVEWRLNFAQWLDVWLVSGKLEQRGRGKGKYVMSRIKDEGGYAMGNVHIQLATDNSKEAMKQWVDKTKANRGVFHLYPGIATPFMAKIGKLSLGLFPSEEEAVKARCDYIAAHGLSLKRDGSVNSSPRKDA